MLGKKRQVSFSGFEGLLAAGVAIGLILTATAVLAGDLTPTAGPDVAGSAMYTMEAIYQRLLSGTAGSKRSGAFTDPTSIGATMHSTDDIMGIAPRTDANGAVSADVCGGKTYWGINASQWGFAAGSPPTPRSGSKDCTVPTISDIANQNISEDASTGAIDVTIGDTGGFASPALRGSSGNTTLVPTDRITFGGSGNSRTVTVSPAADQTGSAVITVTVTDSSNNTASDTFTVTVAAQNDPPVISVIPDQTVNEDNTTSAIPFTITDVDSTLNCGTSVSRSSSNLTVVPLGNIVFGGTAPNCTVRITPAANQNGSADITLTVTDGTATDDEDFTLTVSAVNDVPVAVDDIYSFSHDSSANDIYVLGNDTDADTGDTLTITAETKPSLGGAVTIRGGGTHLRYNPPAPPTTGTDIFYYIFNDGNGGTATGKVTVTVTE